MPSKRWKKGAGQENRKDFQYINNFDGKGEETDIQRGLSLGANEYLLKPISTVRLKEVITKLLA